MRESDILDQIFSKLRRSTGREESVTEDQTPFLVVGLGNPGRDYSRNRHNVGFMMLGCLAERLAVSFSRMQSKALVTKAEYQGIPLILAKPQTYMNLSGQAVGSLARFYKVPMGNLLIVYDDVDLPLGMLRLRPAGGAGGQKGMISIIERLGTEDFPRLRLGIERPPGSMPVDRYVLRDFTSSERVILEPTLERAVDAALVFVTQGLDEAMNKFNGAAV